VYVKMFIFQSLLVPEKSVPQNWSPTFPRSLHFLFHMQMLFEPCAITCHLIINMIARHVI